MADVLGTIGVFFNKRRAEIGSLVLDASVQETHTSSAQITDHPVEDGANITDHVHRQPDSITINGIISNTPTGFPEALPGVPIGRAIANTISGISNDTARTAYDTLRELVDGKALVKIVTTLREYENMLIEELTVDRNAGNGNALNFTARAREIRIVSTKKVSVPVKAPADSKKASKKALGNKPAGDASSSATTDSGTFATRLTGQGVALH